MAKARLLSTVAAALLLTAGVASAQGVKQDEAPAKAPAAQQNAPAEKVAPAMKPGEHKAGVKAPETTGQAAPNAAEHDKSQMKNQTMDKRAPGGAPQESSPANGSADMKAKASETKPDDKAGATKSSQSTEKSSTTGQGAAGSAKLSTEQRTKITTVIKQQKVERVEPAKLNVSISVGTRIPDRGVHFYPLPREVIVIYPEWRGYDYILVGDQIVVVDPRTHEIVAILDA